MPLALTLSVETARFDNMLNDMAKLDPTVEFRTIVVHEAIAVCQGAADRTKAASVGDIQAHEASRIASQEWTTLDGKKYLIKGTGSRGHTNRYPDVVWSSVQSNRAKASASRVAQRVAARGLAKQTWFNLAKSLGGTIQVPGYVQSANYRGKQYQSDVSNTEDSANGKYGLTITNASPIIGYAGGNGALLGAMQARVGYFTQNMAHGFYTTAARMAAKYPGMYVTSDAAATN